jgi:glycosyltransferase involved in cell wall biosynthesis
MNISVILCTLNRCELLAKALESLAVSQLPESTDWEVLVIDNNSTDRTRQVVEDFRRQHPAHFRYVFEPTPGKSHALNRGIQEARGDVLAFADDDATAAPGWLQNLTANLHDGEWAGAAGRVLPEQTTQFPSWVPQHERHGLSPLVVFDPNLEAGPLHEAPFGVNMAFHKTIFAKYGGFRTDLGPGLGKNIPGKAEDSEFGQRLLAAGEHLRYEPAALVYHPISPGRMKKRFFLNWWFDKGRSDIRAFGAPGETRWTVAGVPLCFFRRLGVWTLRWMVAVEPSRRFSAKIKVWAIAGAMLETYRQENAVAVEACPSCNELFSDAKSGNS